MTDLGIPISSKRTIIEQQITVWTNTQYNELINLKVAEKIGDDQMEAAAKEAVKRCEIALDVLNDELKGLKNDE